MADDNVKAYALAHGTLRKLRIYKKLLSFQEAALIRNLALNGEVNEAEQALSKILRARDERGRA